MLSTTVWHGTPSKLSRGDLRLTSRYVKEVIRSYINCKEAHGRTKQEIDWKLEILELEVCQIQYLALTASFQAICSSSRKSGKNGVSDGPGCRRAGSSQATIQTDP